MLSILNLHLCSFLMDVFSPIKEIIIKKKVSKKRNVKYLHKSYYWEKVTYSKRWFSKFKKCVLRLVFGEPQISLNFWGADITEFSKFLLHFKNERSGSKTVCGFLLFLFWEELWCIKVKESMLFVEQKYKF